MIKLIKQIISAYWFLLIKANEKTKRIGKERLEKCKQCPFYRKGICKKCKCWMKAKVLCLPCSCPVGKWKGELIN